MTTVYSTYEAKAKFSEILRQVRSGATVQVSYHGEPVAEIRPLPSEESGQDPRYAELKSRGEIIPARSLGTRLRAGEPKPGALARFLADRDE